MDWKNPLVLKVLEALYRVTNTKGKDVTFCWIPGHAGIQGNEHADRRAEEALNSNITPLQLPYSDFIPHIKEHIAAKWQAKWNNETDNKLHSIQPTIGIYKPGFRKNRREQVVLTRLRIGHTRLTATYIQETILLCVAAVTAK